MALGASPREVVSGVLKDALSMVAVGLGLGLVGTLAATRVMESLLFQVSPRDPLALALACVSIVLIGLIAGFVPARRAAGVQPVDVLRVVHLAAPGASLRLESRSSPGGVIRHPSTSADVRQTAPVHTVSAADLVFDFGKERLGQPDEVGRAPRRVVVADPGGLTPSLTARNGAGRCDGGSRELS